MSVFRAPARVNIIGEHTDYNDGFVLPMTTGLYTTVQVTQRDDHKVEVRSEAYDDVARFNLDELRPPEQVRWSDYVKGVAAQLQEAGIALRGAELAISSTIPVGSGLSSSAALELAVAHALLSVSERTVAAEELAQICRRAEHRFAGVQCGIMDQYTIACARKGHAILLDCRSLEAQQIPLPDGIAFLLVDSGVRHRLPDGSYNDRADECSKAVEILQRAGLQLRSLRDADHDIVLSNEDVLGDVLFRRCRHVVTENDRVRRAAAALHGDALAELGALVHESHVSLRDDYEVSCDEVEAVVDIANDTKGVAGARMIGAGFGGCILVVAASESVAESSSIIAKQYEATLGKAPWMHEVVPAFPAGEVPQE